MPTIEAKRRSPCAACSLPMEVGESVQHSRMLGTRHLACADHEAGSRRNAYVRPCDLCGVELQPGQGVLTVHEVARGGDAWERNWRAVCVDITGCDKRIRGA